jgi:hypothetical protein
MAIQPYEVEFMEWLFSKHPTMQTQILKLLRGLRQFGVPPEQSCKLVRDLIDKE